MNPKARKTGKQYGTLYGIGLGPGDKGLITVKALSALKKTNILAVPLSKGGSQATSMALEIAGQAVNIKGKVLLRLFFPMTRDEAALSKARQSAARKIATRLRTGEDIAFITLGDPMHYSTFSPVAEMVKKGLKGAKVTVIPGITSFSATAALTGTPVAESDERVAILPAVYDMASVKKALKEYDTVVLMKINRVFEGLVSLVQGLGKGYKVAFASRAGWDDGFISTSMDAIRKARPDYFSILIVKKVRE
jgi:precorrin-2/cobalt-factor-2 C20-methyltransferase